MPAGTGVCVVNTVPARTACQASSKLRLVGLDELADALDAEESGVALVGVEHLRRRRPGGRAVGADRAHAADAEQQFLLEPVLGAAAVQPVGDLPGGGVVLLDVAVEQQQRHPADLGHQDLRVQRAAFGQRERDPRRTAVEIQRLDRQALRVERRVALQLPAVARERLAEVPGAVEQTDADDRHAEVARRLEVIAGEDAEAAGVLRQHLGDAELRREVGDAGRAALSVLLALVPARLLEVVGQVVVDVVQPAQEPAVLGERARAARR